MNRLSQAILPLALSIGLAGVLEVPAIASPRYSQYNRSGVVIVSPSKHRHNNYYDNYRYGRNINYGRRDRYNDNYYDRGYRPRRSRRYNSSNCGRGYYRGGRRRRYYSGDRHYRRNSGYIRVIRY